jgi:hypothetical protein
MGGVVQGGEEEMKAAQVLEEGGMGGMRGDADPLGVNVNVTFDEVGGLDEHQCYSVYIPIDLLNAIEKQTSMP